MAKFLVEETAIGPITRVNKLDDGHIMCELCFDWIHPKKGECFVDEAGDMWDNCWRCAYYEGRISLPSVQFPA